MALRMFCAVLGGTEPGLKASMPWIEAGPESKPFPVAIKCDSRDESSEVLSLQPLVKEVEKLSIEEIVAHLTSSKDVGRVIPSRETLFYAVLKGYRVGIYKHWREASTQITGRTYQYCRKFLSFRGALVCMVTKGRDCSIDPVPDSYVLPHRRITSSLPTPPHPPRAPIPTPAPTSSAKKRIPKPPFTSYHEVSAYGRSQPDYSGDSASEDSRSAESDDEPFFPPPRVTIKNKTTGPVAQPGKKMGKKPAPRMEQKKRSTVPVIEVDDDIDEPFIQVEDEESDNGEPPAIWPIYQHIRDLHGIIGTLSEKDRLVREPASFGDLPSLGPVVDSFLDMQGLIPNAVFMIVSSHAASRNVEDFVAVLCRFGMPRREVEWIWQHAH